MFKNDNNISILKTAITTWLAVKNNSKPQLFLKSIFAYMQVVKNAGALHVSKCFLLGYSQGSVKNLEKA